MLQHATEGYLIKELLAKKKVPVSLTLIDSPGGKAECIALLDETAGILDKAGVTVTINTDDSITESRFYLRTAAIAVRGGMSEAAALKAITSTAAKVLHLDHRVGSLEPGKDADFVILSGPPFSTYTKVLETWVDGKKLFNAADETQRPYRDGGWGLPGGSDVPKVPDAKTTLPLPDKIKVLGEAVANPQRTIILADRLHTGTGEIVKAAAITIMDGKIVSVVAGMNDELRDGDAIIHARDVTPGLIDPFCTAGLSGAWNIPADQDQDELGEPNQAELRVMDGYNPREPLLEFLRMNGVTTIHTTPGRKAVIAGTTGVFHLHGATAERAALKPTFAVLVNLGEEPKESKGGPGTRMGTAATVRKAFAEAKAHAVKKGDDKAPNPKAEALIPALEGKMPVVFAAHRADDVRTALRIADEFQLTPIIALGTEAFLLADELAERKVPVIVHPTMQRAGGSMETVNTLLANAAILKSKHVPITLCTGYEGYVPKTRVLRFEAAIAAANGLGHAAAVKAVTLDAAKLLGIDKEYGSIEVGKVADLVLYDGDPFENTTHVIKTIVGGKVVFDRDEYLALPFERRALPMLGGGAGGVGCCLGW